MAVTLFQRSGPGGLPMVVNTSIASLRDSALGTSPGAIDLAVGNDAVLLFKQRNFKGDCLCRRGRQLIRDLGSAKQGGKFGFGNTVSSIRLEPFFLRLNVTVVRKTDGRLPGDWADEFFADIQIGQVVRRANDLLASQQALLELQVATVTVRTDNKKFDLRESETKSFPAAWKEKAMVDVIFVNSFAQEGVAGEGKFPLRGKVVMVAKTRNGDGDLPTDWMAATMVHEVGHYLGLNHKTGAGSRNNLMNICAGTHDEDGNLFFDQLFFDDDQIAEMHNKLAQNLARKNDRNS